MRYALILATLLVCQGCAMFQAPPEIRILRPAATREIHHFQRKMTGIATSAVTAWKKSETTRVKNNYYDELAHFYGQTPTKFTPLYVKGQTAILMNKLGKIEKSAQGVEVALARAQVHLDRALEVLDLFDEWMSTGFSKGDAEKVKAWFEDQSEKLMNAQKDKVIGDLEAKIKALERAAEGD